MAIPTHGPSCRTWTYPTACWECGEAIQILQCTCGSVVLLEAMGWPWPRHDCRSHSSASGGVGGSGLSGWTAVNKLRRLGIPITDAAMEKIFPEERSGPQVTHPVEETKKVDPSGHGTKDLLAVLRELQERTGRTALIESLPVMGKKLLGLEAHFRYWQVTLVRNDVQPNESYTALIPAPLVRTLRRGAMVAARIVARGRGEQACWLVSDIRVV